MLYFHGNAHNRNTSYPLRMETFPPLLHSGDSTKFLTSEVEKPATYLTPGEEILATSLTPMPEWGTTKHENHPHPSLPRRVGGIKAKRISNKPFAAEVQRGDIFSPQLYSMKLSICTIVKNAIGLPSKEISRKGIEGL